MWNLYVFRHPTNPHYVEKLSNLVIFRVLGSTFFAHKNRVNRRNIGTCELLRDPYIVCATLRRRAGTLFLKTPWDDDGAISESSGYLSWKRFEDGRAKLVVSIVAPPERAGVAVLLIEREGANPDVFMYIPERRQVRRVEANTLGASMLGTDLSYEDFTHFQQMVDTGIATRLDDVTLDGYPVYVLENIPVDGKSAYSRILT